MLGKGLESLIPNKNQEEAVIEKPLVQRPLMPGGRQGAEAVFQIEADKIKPNPHQPRKVFDENQLQELAVSIREMGIIQPLIVSKIEKETPYGTDVEYQLVAGERRLMAAKIAGLERVPAIIRVMGSEKEKLETAIVENIQRADLNPIEAARSYAKLQEEFGITQREIAGRVGKSRETIANVLRLLTLPTHMQDAVAGNQLSESQARLLMTVENPLRQNYLFETVVSNNLSVRELKNAIARINRVVQPVNAGELVSGAITAAQHNQFDELLKQLEALLNTKVSIQRAGAKNILTIDFSSEEDLQALITKLQKPS